MALESFSIPIKAITCEGCRFWVGHNHANPHIGECTRPKDIGMKVRLINAHGKELPHSDVHAIVLTPFDWYCPAWTPSGADLGNDAQASP